MKIVSGDIECIILASGASHRFGSAKMLHRLNDGTTILAKTIGVYSQVFERVSVVVRDGDDPIIRLVEKEGASYINNVAFDQGLSKSVVAGVRASTPSRAWLIALGDMPYLSVSTLFSLVFMANKDSIVVPRTTKGIGNPVIFGADYREELLRLSGDVGAKRLLSRYANRLFFHDCDDVGVHHDIDRPSDILPHS